MRKQTDLYNIWLADPYDSMKFLDYVRYLVKIEKFNEIRIYELYKSILDFSLKDWPNIAACALGSREDFIRKVAIELLGHIDPLISLPTLSYIYNNTDSIVEKGTVLLSMGRSEDSSIIPFIIYSFRGETSWKIREEACYALGTINSERAIPFLYDIIIGSEDVAFAHSSEINILKEQALKSIIAIEGFISIRRLYKILLNKKLEFKLRKMAAIALYHKDVSVLNNAYDIISLDEEESIHIKDIILQIISEGVVSEV